DRGQPADVRMGSRGCTGRPAGIGRGDRIGDVAASGEGRSVMDKRGWCGWRRPTGAGGVLRLAWPVILSNGCWAAPPALHRMLLSRAGCDGIGAVTVGTMLYWTPVCLLSNVAGYASILVAQYVGAGQPRRVGPAVWQGIHLSLVAGLAFLGLVPLAGSLVAL